MARDQQSSSPLTVVQLLVGMGLFGTSTPLSKIVGENFSVFTASCLRMTIASLVLAPAVWFATDRFARVQRSDWKVIVAISAFGMVGFTATMLFGMRLTTGVIGSTIMSATPAVTALAAVVFFGAAMNWRKAGALALGVGGIAVINLFRGSGDGQGGDALLLGAALVGAAICMEAAYTLLSRKLSDGISSLETTLAAAIMAASAGVTLSGMPFAPDSADPVPGNSSPVARIATRGRRRTTTASAAEATAVTRAAGVSCIPAASTASPAAKSDARRLTWGLSPGATARAPSPSTSGWAGCRRSARKPPTPSSRGRWATRCVWPSWPGPTFSHW